jgi:hypothetical protein
MGEWLKANGGPLALVVVGLSLSGFRSDAAWFVAAIGIVWLIGRWVYRHLPWEIRPKRPIQVLSGDESSRSTTTPSQPKSALPAVISPIAVQPLPPGVYLVDLRASLSQPSAPIESALAPLSTAELSPTVPI